MSKDEKSPENLIQDNSDYKKAHDKWVKEVLEPALAKHPERNKKFMTTSSQEVDRLYTPLDNLKTDFNKDISFPGEFPYTRGIHSTMYRGRLWTMRMFAGFGSAEETNERFKYLLSQGNAGLSTAFDLPTERVVSEISTQSATSSCWLKLNSTRGPSSLGKGGCRSCRA